MTAVVIQPGAALAPDGRSSASLMRDSSTPGVDVLGLWQSVPLASPSNATLSLRVKAAGDRSVCLSINNDKVIFNPSRNAVSAEGAAIPSVLPLDDGWFEVAVTSPAVVGRADYSITLRNGDGGANLPGDGESGVLIFGADFKTGDLSSYIPTGDTPVTLTDYSADTLGVVTFTLAPDVGAQLFWQGYYDYYRASRSPTLIEQTIMSQYANSPVLLRLIEGIGERIDPSADIEQFYNIVMNLHTAQGFGLDIWGRIVGISRRATFADPAGEYFGFADGFYPFNQRPFFSPGQNAYELPDNVYRGLIFIKAAANIINATAPNINRLMKAAFDGKKCYFLITGHMKARYVFEFALTPFERFLVYNTDILPRPCGVEIEVLDAIPPETFGFAGTSFQPFNQGTFYGGL